MTITTLGFTDLGVAPDLVEALNARGIEQPFPIQSPDHPRCPRRPATCAARPRPDRARRSRSGSRRSSASLAPSPRRPTGLVLVPTRELAVQVCDELTPLAAGRDMTVSAIYGGARIERQIARLAKGVDLVVATPGRMIDLIERKEIFVADVSCVVIDEADRMADMGFLPQVEWILRNVEGQHQTLLFSATLDGAVNSLVRRYQTDPVTHEVESKLITVDEMVAPLPARPRDGQGEGGCGDRRRCRAHHGVLGDQARRRPAVPRAQARGCRRRGDPRRPSSGPPGEGTRGLRIRAPSGPGRHRCGGSRDPCRRCRRRGPLRPAPGSQDLSAPLGPHGASRGSRVSW